MVSFRSAMAIYEVTHFTHIRMTPTNSLLVTTHSPAYLPD